MSLRWNEENTRAIATLNEIQKIYRDAKRCQPADGGLMPSEPMRGHVHCIGTDREPLIIMKVDYSRRIVLFAPLNPFLSQSVHDGSCVVKDDGIVYPRNSI